MKDIIGKTVNKRERILMAAVEVFPQGLQQCPNGGDSRDGRDCKGTSMNTLIVKCSCLTK